MSICRPLLVLLGAGFLAVAGSGGPRPCARADEPLQRLGVSIGFELADEYGSGAERGAIPMRQPSHPPSGRGRGEWMKGVLRFFLPGGFLEPSGRFAAGAQAAGAKTSRIVMGTLLSIDSEGHLLVHLNPNVSIELGPDLGKIEFEDPIRGLEDVLPAVSISTSFRFE